MTKIKRIYEKSSPQDGFRVLVDRLWPRGVSKKAANVDWWAKEVAPSSKLRVWFHSDPAGRLKEFRKRYRGELKKSNALNEFKEIIRKKSSVTLLTAVKDLKHSHISLLARKLK